MGLEGHAHERAARGGSIVEPGDDHFHHDERDDRQAVDDEGGRLVRRHIRERRRGLAGHFKAHGHGTVGHDRHQPHDDEVDPQGHAATHEARMLRRLCIGQLPWRYYAAEQPCAHPAEGSTQGVGDHVVHIAAAVGVGVDAEQARELGHLDEQGCRQAQQHRRKEAQAQKPPGDKAQRHEEHYVEGQLEHRFQAVLRDIVHEVHRVEVGGDAVGDAETRVSLGQRVQREAAEAADVEHREVGSHKRAEAQPPVTMIEVGQNRQREHERKHRPQHQCRSEVLAVIP